jgi:hypothetical protein
MADILLINYSKTDSCAFYRSSGIAHNLAKQSGHNIQSISWKEIEINWAVISDFDLILFQRPFNKPAFDLISYIKQMNKPVWVDYDDNLLCVPPENGNHSLYNDTENRKALKEILSIADVVTVTNENLKEAYLPFNLNISVIPNAFNDSIFKRSDIMPIRNNSVVWRGTETHIYDLMNYGSPINLASEDFKEWKFIFVGFYPWFLNKSANKGFVKGSDIIVYFKNLMGMAPACVHVPLHDNPFNRSKSNIAYIEASYFGAISIVPEWWEAPGALKYTDPQSYYECMKAVCSCEIDIEKSNQISWEYIQDELTLTKINKQRIEIINSLI